MPHRHSSRRTHIPYVGHRAHKKNRDVYKIVRERKKRDGILTFSLQSKGAMFHREWEKWTVFISKDTAAALLRMSADNKGAFNLRNHDYSCAHTKSSLCCLYIVESTLNQEFQMTERRRECSVEETGIHKGTRPACQKVEVQTDETDRNSPGLDEPRRTILAPIYRLTLTFYWPITGSCKRLLYLRLPLLEILNTYSS